MVAAHVAPIARRPRNGSPTGTASGGDHRPRRRAFVIVASVLALVAAVVLPTGAASADAAKDRAAIDAPTVAPAFKLDTTVGPRLPLAGDLGATSSLVSGSFSGCSAAEQAAIEAAYPAAEGLATESLGALQTAADPSAAPRFLHWFGLYDAARYATVQSHFTAMAAFFSTHTVGQVPWICNGPPCSLGTFAYVFPADPTFAIGLCSAFFASPVSGVDSQAGTLVHELSHFVAIAGTSDFAYGMNDAAALAAARPTNAIANADNHQYFAENPTALAMGAVLPADTTAPSITPTITGTLGTGGWYRSDVTVTWTVTDGESPITTAPCTDGSVIADTTGTTFSCTAQSTGGTTTESVTIRRDATAPTAGVAGVIDGQTFAVGEIPTPSCTTTETTSGIATSAVLLVNGGPTAFTATCDGATDQAGNVQTSAVVATYRITPVPVDATAPSITPTITGTLGTGGWYRSDVTITWTVTDDESPITTTPCATGAVTTDTTGTTLTCTAQSTGGTTTASVTIRRDATAPTANVLGLAATAYVVGSVPNPGCGTTDSGGSQVASAATLSWSPSTPATAGQYTASCTGAMDGAGNPQAVPASVTITVTAPAPGVNRAALSLIITCPSSVKLGATITITVKLANAGPATATATGMLLSVGSGATVTDLGAATSPRRGIVAWNAGDIPAGSSRTLTLKVKAVEVGRTNIGAVAASSTAEVNLVDNIAVAALTVTR